jgi:membrane protein YdbS with pleckstrin-like domain
VGTPVFRAGEGLEPLHPDHLKVLRIRAGITALVLLVPTIVAEIALDGWHGVFALPWLVFVALFVWRVPSRRWSFKGFSMEADRLRVVRGFLWHSDTLVPFTRVQHIDVNQSPLERLYSLATLTVHTAGTHNSSVHLEGIARERADAMREEIRARIKRETL